MTLNRKDIPHSLYQYIFACFLLTLALRIILTGWYNSSYGGIEQNVIYGIQRVMSRQPLYQDPSAGTYAIMQYTPFYYLFIANLARISGVGYHDVQEIYMLCRATALLFNILTVFTAALIIRSWRYSWLCCFAFAMPVLIMLTSHYYTRGDSMHLFFFAATFYSYVLHSRRKGLRDILAAAIFSAGCIMTKQSGILIAGIIASCLFFIEKKPLTLLFYSLCTLVFAYLIADLAVQDDWLNFYRNAYLGLKNGVDLSFLFLIFTSQYFLDMVPCYITGGIIVWLALKKTGDKTFCIMAAGAVLSFVFAVVTGLKVGSSNNYFMEFLLFVFVALPYLLQHAASSAKLASIAGRTITIKHFGYTALIVLVTSKTIGLFTAMYIEKGLKNMQAEYDKQQALYTYTQQHLQLTTGAYIYFTDRMFFDNIFIDNATMVTKDVVNQTYAANPSTFDYSRFATGMNTGMITYIITSKKKPDINEWQHLIPFIHFDLAKYKLLTAYGDYTIYEFTP